MVIKENLFDNIINRFIYNSKTGEIFSNKSNMNRPLGSISKGGYLETGISIENIPFRMKIHRLAWRLYYGKWPMGTINHKNGIKHDNRIENLEDITIQENLKHSIYELGNHWIGENHGKSILTEKEILEIREKYIPWKYTMRMLADEYNVCYSTIQGIITKKYWKHI